MESIIPTVTIKLGDKDRHLKLTLGGMRKFEEATGKNLLKGFNLKDMGAGDLIALIWACLVWEDKELSLDDLGYMLDVNRINEITQAMNQAITNSIPESKGKKSPNP